MPTAKAGASTGRSRARERRTHTADAVHMSPSGSLAEVDDAEAEAHCDALDGSGSASGSEGGMSSAKGCGSSSGGGVRDDKERRIRREIANCNERRRMQSINSGFTALRARLSLDDRDGHKLSKARVHTHMRLAMILQLAVRQIDRLSCDKSELLGQLRALTERLQSMQQEALLQRGDGGGERASPQRQAARAPPAPVQSLAPNLHPNPHLDEAHETRPAMTVVAGRPGARVGGGVSTAPLPIRKRRPPPSGGNQSSVTRAQQQQQPQQQQQHLMQQVPAGTSTVFNNEEPPPSIIFSISALPTSSVSSVPEQLTSARVVEPDAQPEAASSSEQRPHRLMKLQQGIQNIMNNLDTDELKLRVLTSSSSSSHSMSIGGPVTIGGAQQVCGSALLVSAPQRCQPLSIDPTNIDEQLLGVSDLELDEETDLELQLATTLGREAPTADEQQRRPSTSASNSNSFGCSGRSSLKNRSSRLPSGASQSRVRASVHSPKLNSKRRNPSGSSLSGQPPSPSRRRRNTSNSHAQLIAQPVAAVVVSAAAPVVRSQAARKMEPASTVSVPVPTVIRAQHTAIAPASAQTPAPAPAPASAPVRDSLLKEKFGRPSATQLAGMSLSPSNASFAAGAPPIIYLAPAPTLHGFHSPGSPQLLSSLPFPMGSPVPVSGFYNMGAFEPASAANAQALASPAAAPYPLHYPVLLHSPMMQAPLVAHPAPVRQLVSPQPQPLPQPPVGRPQHMLTTTCAPAVGPVPQVHSMFKASSALLSAASSSAASSASFEALPPAGVQAAPLAEARQSAREQTLDAIIEAIRHVEGYGTSGAAPPDASNE